MFFFLGHEPVLFYFFGGGIIFCNDVPAKLFSHWLRHTQKCVSLCTLEKSVLGQGGLVFYTKKRKTSGSKIITVLDSALPIEDHTSV